MPKPGLQYYNHLSKSIFSIPRICCRFPSQAYDMILGLVTGLWHSLKSISKAPISRKKSDRKIPTRFSAVRRTFDADIRHLTFRPPGCVMRVPVVPQVHTMLFQQVVQVKVKCGASCSKRMTRVKTCVRRRRPRILPRPPEEICLQNNDRRLGKYSRQEIQSISYNRSTACFLCWPRLCTDTMKK